MNKKIQHVIYEKKTDTKFLNDLINKVSMNKNSYIFGGYVRDKFNNDNFNDVDIMLSTNTEISKLINFLLDSNRLIEKQKIKPEFNNYFLYKLKIETPLGNIINIDLVNNINNNNCDFTCNNLILKTDGSISTRIDAPKSLKIDKFDWLLRCINDCKNKKLTWIYPKLIINEKNMLNFNDISTMFKLKKRYDNLCSKGFVYDENLTDFEFCFPISVYDIQCDEECCSICQQKYISKINNNEINDDLNDDLNDDNDNLNDDLDENIDYENTVVCDCGHHFHWCCLSKWIIKKKTCPCCREKITFNKKL